MKKIEIYKKDALTLVIIVDSYEINTYTNSFELVCKHGDIDITYNIPLDEGYRVTVEI